MIKQKCVDTIMLKSYNRKQTFDRHHQGKDKHINIGDKILIRKPKTTTKPVFYPSSYQVTQLTEIE